MRRIRLQQVCEVLWNHDLRHQLGCHAVQQAAEHFGCEPESLRECVSRSLCGGTAYDFVGIALIDIVDRPNNYVHVGLTDRASTVLKEWLTAMSSNLEFDLLSWFPFDQEIGRWNHE